MNKVQPQWMRDDLGPAEVWATYPKIETAARRLMEHGKDAEALEDFSTEVSALGLHALMAAAALTACSVFELASLEQRRPATIVALMSRVVPWRDQVGVVVHAILSAWVHRNRPQAVMWIEREVDEGRSVPLARALGERLVFSVEAAGLFSGMSAEERQDAFAGRFFGAVTEAEADSTASGHDAHETRPPLQWPDYPDWQGELAPLAPCRRPGCPGVVRWRAVSPFEKLEGELEHLFCTLECERKFWEARGDYQDVIGHLVQSRVDEPEFWRDKRGAWDKQFNLAWWHLARHMGVRPYATDPEKAKWHEHYFAVGRMIARAAEWESASETVLALFLDVPQDRYRQAPVSQVVDTWRKNAHRWPHVEDRIVLMCDAATDAIDLRNWLVHSFVVPSGSGDGAHLQKPVRNQERWATRSVRLRQIELLASRFQWMFEALNRILADQHPDEPTMYTGELGAPPTLDLELGPAPS